jgi:hypothetical protein
MDENVRRYVRTHVGQLEKLENFAFRRHDFEGVWAETV